MNNNSINFQMVIIRWSSIASLSSIKKYNYNSRMDIENEYLSKFHQTIIQKIKQSY